MTDADKTHDRLTSRRATAVSRSDIRRRSRRRGSLRTRRGFTIVEMLIAMTITLLMMAALGRAFALLGETIRLSRVEVDLSVQAREITRRLSDDLARCTVRGDRPARQQEGRGYFVYYDGPLSSASGAMLGESPDPAVNENTFQDSKYGDFDDYIAFTAEAEEGNWFSGKVPRFILDLKRQEIDGYDATKEADYNPLAPVVITSKYAEIIYFASPQYATVPDPDDPSQQNFVYDGTGNPVPLDVDEDLIPDTVRLHRRVLLIRPDLNLTATGGLPQLPYSHPSPPATVSYMVPDTWPTDTDGAHPAIKTASQAGLAWLMGMAAVHQQCDLSVRRVLTPGGLPTFATGMGPLVAANSLADVTYPHNRFAHVRMPPGAVGLSVPRDTHGYTSMPVLALGGSHALLTRAVAAGAAPPAQFSSSAQTVTPVFLNGFLRPEFALGQDLTHTDYPGDGWGIERRGEDVVAGNILGFDVKGFDPSAAVFLTSGADGAYGGANGGGVGASAGDDLAITPADPAYFEAVRTSLLPPATTPTSPDESVVGMRGAFVDLFYPFQAGGTLRGLMPIRRDIHTSGTVDFPSGGAATPARAGALLKSGLSAYSSLNHKALLADNAAFPNRSHYEDRLFESGRLVRSGMGNSGTIRLLQPVYDTFTDGYERDGFRQDDGYAIGGTGVGTLWWLNNPTTGIPPVGPLGDFQDKLDSGRNGVYDDLLGSSGTRDEQETSPPFEVSMPAVQVTIRIENPNTRQLQQMSVVRQFGE